MNPNIIQQVHLNGQNHQWQIVKIFNNVNSHSIWCMHNKYYKLPVYFFFSALFKFECFFFRSVI